MNNTTESAGAHYTVVGAGAIGGTLAYHLLRAGKNVTLVDADRDHVDSINKHGLRIESTIADLPALPVQASTPEDHAGRLGPVILAVKAQHTDTAARWIAPRLEPDGWVVSMQNGLNEDTIATHVGRNRTVGAFVNLNADVISPGVIRDGGLGALVIGELDRTDSSRVHVLAADLSSWGPVTVSGNVQGYLWAKLAYGAMLTATALSNTPMADSMATHDGLMTSVAREVCAVARAQGITLESFDAFNAGAYSSNASPAEGRAATRELAAWLATLTKTHSGIWRDIAVRKRKTEVPSQYGQVISSARATGIATPFLDAVLAALDGIERGSRGLAETNLVELSSITEKAA